MGAETVGGEAAATARRVAAVLDDPGLWPTGIAEAAAVQRRLAGDAATHGPPIAELSAIRTVAGLDVSYSADGRLAAAAVAVDTATLRIVESSTVLDRPRFPYVPGLFAFRELPGLLRALQRLTVPVDAYLCDGAGLAHPRRFGLACHLGVLLGRPSLGVAKSRLVGHAEPPEAPAGSRSAIVVDGAVVGVCLRTRTGVRPVYVSPGHRMTPDQAAELTLRLCDRARIPEPVRAADRLSRAAL